jgi:hypothetical protein
MVVKRDANGENPRIHCNDCGTPAPPGDQILAGRGLNNMGWHCVGGSHLCPEHAPPRESTQ